LQHLQEQGRTAVTAWLQHCLLLAGRTVELLLLVLQVQVLLLQVLPLLAQLLLLAPAQVVQLQYHPMMKCPDPGSLHCWLAEQPLLLQVLQVLLLLLLRALLLLALLLCPSLLLLQVLLLQAACLVG
jgi:hypothetical protein